MKKVLIFSIFILILCEFCFAQNANFAQKIIGTWIDHYGGTWVFNANGTLKMPVNSSTIADGKFCILDTKLAFYSDSRSLSFFDISMSSDGKTLFLIPIGGPYGYWLTKK